MAGRKDSIKELLGSAEAQPPSKEAERLAERQRRQLYAAALQAQVQAKEESRRRERDASLRQSRQLLELRQGGAGGAAGAFGLGASSAGKTAAAVQAPVQARAGTAAAGPSIFRQQPPAQPAALAEPAPASMEWESEGQLGASTQGLPQRYMPSGRHEDAHLQALPPPLPGYPRPPLPPRQALSRSGGLWPLQLEQLERRQQSRGLYEQGGAAVVGGEQGWASVPAPWGGYATASPITHHPAPAASFRLPPSALAHPLDSLSQLGRMHPSRGSGAGGAFPPEPPMRDFPMPGGRGDSSNGNGSQAWHGGGFGGPPGSFFVALAPGPDPEDDWGRYMGGVNASGGSSGFDEPQQPRAALHAAPAEEQPPAPFRSAAPPSRQFLSAAARAPFGTDIQPPPSGPASRSGVAGGSPRRGQPALNRSSAAGGSGPPGGAAAAAAPLESPRKADLWDVAVTSGKLAAFGAADDEQKKQREGQRKAAYKAELEAQMRAKEARHQRERAERLREELWKEQERSGASPGGLLGLGWGQGGYGGGSGPLRDEQGNIVADLNQVRRYQQAQQLRTSLSASQSALQQLARELQAAEAGPAGAAGSTAGGAEAPAGSPGPAAAGAPASPWAGLPAAFPAARTEPALWLDQRGGVQGEAAHAEHAVLHGHAAGFPGPSPPANSASEDSHAGQLAALSRGTSSFQGQGAPQQWSAAEVTSSLAGSGASPAWTGGTGMGTSNSAGACSGPAAAGAAGGGAAGASAAGDEWRGAASGVIVNLKSDRPFQTAGDVERKQRLQEAFKEALQQQIEEKRRKKEEEQRRRREEDEAEEARLRREQERLMEQFEAEQRGGGKKGDKQVEARKAGGGGSGGAETMESGGILIKFKPPPPPAPAAASTTGAASRRRPSQALPTTTLGDERSPGVEIRYKPPPPAALVKPSGQQQQQQQPARQEGEQASGLLAPSVAAVAEEGGAAEPGGYPPGMHPPGGQESAAWGPAHPPLSRDPAAGGRGPGGLDDNPFAVNPFEAAAREDSIRAALAVQRREMQELRERAAAAEFHSSAARRQLEALTDMVRWQGADAGASAAMSAAGALPPLALPHLAHPAHYGSAQGHVGAGAAHPMGAGTTGVAAAAAPARSGTSAGDPAWRASAIWGPLPVYETLSSLDSRPSTAAGSNQPPPAPPAPLGPANLKGASPLSPSWASGGAKQPLSRGDLVEHSLAGTSALIFPPTIPTSAPSQQPQPQPALTSVPAAVMPAPAPAPGPLLPAAAPTASRLPRGLPPRPPAPASLPGVRPRPQSTGHAGAGALASGGGSSSSSSSSSSSPRGSPLPLTRRATVHGAGASRAGDAWDRLLSPAGHSRRPSWLTAPQVGPEGPSVGSKEGGLLGVSRQSSFTARRRTSRFASESAPEAGGAPEMAGDPAGQGAEQGQQEPQRLGQRGKGEDDGSLKGNWEELDQFMLDFEEGIPAAWPQ